MTSNDLPPDFPLLNTVNLDYAHGGSQIVAPLGIPLAPPASGDTILYADCQADMIKVWKAIIDTVGHYARPDIVRLQYLAPAPTSLAELARQAVEKSSPDDLEAVAERHALSKQELESAIEHLAQGGR
jgi:nitrilase